MGLNTFFDAAWEIFKGPLVFLAAPAIPLCLISLTIITAMMIQEFQKNS